MVAVAAAAIGVFALTPSPYVIQFPGPTYDTLGTVSNGQEEIALISISGEPTYTTTGELNLLTVSMRGNPDHPLNWLETGMAWFTPGAVLLPMEAVFPSDVTVEERREQDAAAMSSSQQDAIAAALNELGYAFETTLSVGAVIEDSPSDGIFEEGDVILSVQGEPVSTVEEIRARVAAGEGSPIEIIVLRSGVQNTLTVTPVQQDGNWLLGIGVQAEYEFPFDVVIHLDDVGGPSAGMVFALGIVDQLTDDELTGGRVWSGTGTITAGGTVGAIGGIEQKMYGARNAGATYMLAPRDNCDEVVGNVPSGLDVFPVSNLQEARAVMKTVASGDFSSLPRCESK